MHRLEPALRIGILAALIGISSCASDPGTPRATPGLDGAATDGAGTEGGVDGAVDSATSDANVQCLRDPAPTGACGCQAYGCVRVNMNICASGLVPLFCENATGVHDGLQHCTNSTTDGTMCDGGFGGIYCCPVP